jgi:ABC-type dipeptide/oligopeptide/nickel transport system permease component
MGLIPVGIGVVAIVSLLIHVVPGDPVDAMLGPYATIEEKESLRSSLGLNESLPVQLKRYYLQLASGSLGTSLIFQRPVVDLIAERVQATVELAVVALLVAMMISIPLGIISAVKKGSLVDYGAMGFALLGICIPNFWLGPMLVLLFSLHFGWLPVSERGDFATYILPAVTLGTALASILSRMTRTSMLDNLREDYVRTARAKGNTEKIVILKHVLRNAALPLVTVIGLQFGVLLTGAIITERIFDWPGLGTLTLEGIFNRDYPLVQGCVLMFSATYLIVNLLTDVMYAAVDPRIKLDGRGG